MADPGLRWNGRGQTHFHAVGPDRESVRWLMKEKREALLLVARHGLGDLVFMSCTFPFLRPHFGNVYFTNCVNAYTRVFDGCTFVTPIYAGGTNDNSLGLTSNQAFIDHFRTLGLALPEREAFVYHFGLFEPDISWEDPRAFSKGRRNLFEFYDDAIDVQQVATYHVGKRLSQQCVDSVLADWFPERELFVIARYGHTDPEKNFGHGPQDVLQLVDYLNAAYAERFRFLSLDYAPGQHSADGHRYNLRSVYGYLPCDASSLLCILHRAKYFLTVPTGPMVLGACLPDLCVITLWKTMVPYRFLDPQWGPGNRVYALLTSETLNDLSFVQNWSPAQRESLSSRWDVRTCSPHPHSLIREVHKIIEERTRRTNEPRGIEVPAV